MKVIIKIFSIFFIISHIKAFVQKPNILFIIADDLGWNDVGYHQSEIKTPTIDQLADEGIKLESYYVQPICTPSRSQLLSGKYQIHTGLQHEVISLAQPWGLRPEIPTLAEQLRHAGYATHIVGKWHVGFFKSSYLPTRRGFDTAFGYYGGMEDYYKHEMEVEVTDGGKTYKLSGIDFHQNDKPFNASGLYSTHLFAQQAEQVVRDHVQSASSKPLFLYLPFQAAHSPLEVPANYLQPYQDIVNLNRRRYAGMVSCLDEAVANVTAAFKKYGLWNNTVVIFSTDNGGDVAEGGYNWPLRGWKRSYWEGGVRGVGFVHSALLQQKGIISNELIHISDWFPTLIHLAGGTANGLELDGFNVWPTISQNEPSPRKELLHNIDPMGSLTGAVLPWSPFDNRVTAAIRVGPWKLLTGYPGQSGWVPPPSKTQPSMKDVYQFQQNSNAQLSWPSDTMFVQSEPSDKNIWLFNIINDPLEKIDLSDARSDIVADLLLRLAYYNSTAVPVFYETGDLRADPAKHGGYWRPWLD